MPETNDSTNPVSEAAVAREKFEQEKMSRRAALRKIGLTSGMALFGMFAVDDFARLALSGLKQHKETQAVAETVAQELRSSGVAFASDGSPSDYNTPCWENIATSVQKIHTACQNPSYYCTGSPTPANCIYQACRHYFPNSIFACEAG